MKVVTYKRVSTGQQAKSGLGIEAQQEYIDTALSRMSGCEVIGEYTDEGVSGSLPVNDREGLKAAVALCMKTGAALLVAKLDRLSRSVSDISTLENTLPRLLVANMPNADKFQLQLFAALAEKERDFIKDRTKEALSQLQNRADNGDAASIAKIARRNATMTEVHKRGVNRVNSLAVRQAKAMALANNVGDNIIAARSKGCDSLQKVADYLNNRGIKTSRGKAWTATAVKRVEDKIKAC